MDKKEAVQGIAVAVGAVISMLSYVNGYVYPRSEAKAFERLVDERHEDIKRVLERLESKLDRLSRDVGEHRNKR